MASFSNLTYSVVSGAAGTIVSTGVSQGLKYMNQALGQTPGSQNAKFYYNAGDGGILNVVAKRIAGGAIAYAQKAAIDQLKALLLKKKGIDKNTEKSKIQILSDQANQSDGANQIDTKKKYGIMKVNNGNDTVLALDFVGNWCPDAVMLGIPVNPNIMVNQFYVDDSYANKYRKESTRQFSSDTLVWYDVTALITVQNERKLIITPVTGRDYSRKELMSNGDINFTITGRINSNLPDVYPTSEVQKFIQIMQYRGPVKISSQFLDQYNIEKMVVTGYSLPQKEGYRNIQEYTINCVGIQPVKDVKVTEDTIISLNREIKQEVDKNENKWSKLLNNTVEGLKSSAVSAISNNMYSTTKALSQRIADNSENGVTKFINNLI